MGIGFKELLLTLLVVLLIFGAGRLKTIGSDLGQAIRGFRQAVGDTKDGAGSGDRGDAGPK